MQQLQNNNKYKTSLCKHWTTQGNCSIGARCHFAHGKEELRSMQDPLQNPPPPNEFFKPQQYIPIYQQPQFQVGQIIQQQHMMNLGQQINFKSIKCRFFDLGMCKFKDQCNFAHSDIELRPVTDPNQINVINLIKQYNQFLQQMQLMKDILTNQIKTAAQQMENDINKQQEFQKNHIFKMQDILQKSNIPINTNLYTDNYLQKQIVTQQLFHIIVQLEKLQLPQDYQALIRVAIQVLSSDNIPACASILNDIITKTSLNEEIKTKLDKIVADSTALGVALVSQYQLQLQHMTGGIPVY